MVSSTDPLNNAAMGAFFADFAALVYASDNYDGIFQAVCAAAPSFVTGCDHASLMLRHGKRSVTAASSDDVALQVDAFERETGTGPCIETIEDGTPHLDADLLHPILWPILSERVVQSTPVRGFASFRVLIDNRKVGALNLFSDTPGALTHRSIDEAAILAAFTSIALGSISARESATTMRSGLHNNREIGKAIGLLMAFHRINDADAFAMLCRTSQDLNLKISAIAHEILTNHRKHTS